MLDATTGNGSSDVEANSTSDVGADMTPDHDDDILTDAMVPDVTVTADNGTDYIQRNRGPSKLQTQPNTKRSKSNVDEEIDVNRSCASFGLYADDAGTGREWL